MDLPEDSIDLLEFVGELESRMLGCLDLQELCSLGLRSPFVNLFINHQQVLCCGLVQAYHVRVENNLEHSLVHSGVGNRGEFFGT